MIEVDWAEERNRVQNIVSKSVPDSDVEDVTHNILLSIYSGLSNFKGESTFRTWAYPIIRGGVANYYRKNNGKVIFSSELSDLNLEKLSCEMDIVEKLTIDEIFKVAAGLKPLHKESFHLHFRMGLGHSEIAEMSNASSYETVRSTYRRAILAFKDLWLFNRNPTVYTHGRLVIGWRRCELATCSKKFKVHLHGKLQRYCNQSHQVIAWKRRTYPPEVLALRMCMLPGCNVLFMPTRSWSKYCSPEHQIQAKVQRRTEARRVRRSVI